MKRLLLLLSLVVAGSSMADPDLSAFREGDASLRARLEGLEGAPPPELKVSRWINLKATTLEKLKGKIIVLDFWATWCGPCIASIPHTNELAEKYKDKVVFIGVCHPEGGEKMSETVRAKGIEYPVCLDNKGDTGKAYKVNGYPDYYIIDATGKLVVADCANKSVEDAIKALLQ